MSTPFNAESNQPIIPLQPEHDATEEQSIHRPATEILGMYVVNTANMDTTTAVMLAELPSAEDIPSLLPELAWITSANEHKYDDSNTVYTKSALAKKAPENKRSGEQQQLLDDMNSIKTFAPDATVHEDVYTPLELHSLVVELRTLTSKKRPDFSGVEGRVLDIVMGAIQSTDLVPVSIKDIAKRAAKNYDGRKGMQWDTLTKLANEASKIIQRKVTESSSEYYIMVADPDPKTYPDLSKVYQFVADYHALGIIGKRTDNVSESRCKAFVDNCEVVNGWYAQVAPVLATLPRGFMVGRFGAAWLIDSMVATMNARLIGDEKTGRNKDYRADPAGAISLQKRIGHTIEAIKQKLLSKEADGTEIVPLED